MCCLTYLQYNVIYHDCTNIFYGGKVMTTIMHASRQCTYKFTANLAGSTKIIYSN